MRGSSWIRRGDEVFAEGLILLSVILVVVAVLLVLVVFLAKGMFKPFSYLFGIVLALTCMISALLLRATRIANVPGSYKATGVWGILYPYLACGSHRNTRGAVYGVRSAFSATLQTTSHSTVSICSGALGKSVEETRFDRKLVISSIMALDPGVQGRVYSDFECFYGLVMLSGLG